MGLLDKLKKGRTRRGQKEKQDADRDNQFASDMPALQ